MILKIFKATDAFLYLPTYIAEDLRILDTLLKPFGVSQIQFFTPDGGGDANAVQSMLEENSNDSNSIAIAIADPTSFISIRSKNNAKSNCRVIAAIINKLPFWAVDHCNKVFSSISEFNEEFDTVIHYKENLVTGSYLGNKVKNESRIEKFEIVDFGEEIALLNANNSGVSKSVAITADIVSIVKGLNAEEPLKINYKFSQNGEFLTTGIITSKKVCENHPEILSKIIEAIQKAILFIYSSEEMARKACISIAQKQGLLGKDDFSIKEINKIVELISEEKFYPADLNISEMSWQEAIRALSKTQQWDEAVTKHMLATSFSEYVDNSFVLRAEKKIADQVGIDLTTFSEEIENVLQPYKISQIEGENLKTRYEKWTLAIARQLSLFSRFLSAKVLTKRSALWIFILLLIIVVYQVYLFKTKGQIDIDGLKQMVIVGIPVSILANILTPKRKNDDE